MKILRKCTYFVLNEELRLTLMSHTGKLTEGMTGVIVVVSHLPNLGGGGYGSYGSQRLEDTYRVTKFIPSSEDDAD